MQLAYCDTLGNIYWSSTFLHNMPGAENLYQIVWILISRNGFQPSEQDLSPVVTDSQFDLSQNFLAG